MKRIQIARKREKGTKASSEMYKLTQKMKTMFGHNSMDIPRLNPSPRELVGGYMGGTGKLYEMEGGVVMCYEHDYMNGSNWDVMLLGFNEENKTYQKLKPQLEELASDNPEGIGKVMEDEPLDFSERFPIPPEELERYKRELEPKPTTS